MFVLLQKFDINPKEQIIMAGDFYLFFASKLDAKGENSTITKKSLAKLTKLKESYDLCDASWIPEKWRPRLRTWHVDMTKWDPEPGTS